MALEENVWKAAQSLRKARSLVITAGAGMGVDSGLPDFRGDQGFWKAYPLYKRLGLSFVNAANPGHFEQNPAFGWGFYGHRLNLYRETIPHPGFDLLKSWVARFRLNTFLITSNVDGQFQKAGFPEDRILEVHGSIHHLQCVRPCSSFLWENAEVIPVDTDTMLAQHIPRCPRCDEVARPNILMFGDWAWIEDRAQEQQLRLEQFLAELMGPLVVIECGAGTAIPTIRDRGERLARWQGATLIRINPREGQVPSPGISIPTGALEGLRGIEAALGE